MKKKIGQICLLCGLFLLMSGCFLQSGEELYSLPDPPADYLNLQESIGLLLKQGAEYTAPLSGSNTQAIQLVDLDGDGVQEALAFLRMEGEKPLKIFLFRQTEGTYQVMNMIEGDGTAFNSVVYADLDGSSGTEIVVSWQMSTGVYSLSAYSLKNQEVTEMMKTGYSRYAVSDLNRDGKREIIVLQLDTVEGNHRAEYYLCDDEGHAMIRTATVNLSAGIGEIIRVRNGTLQNGIPALFVTGGYSDGAIITDILACRAGVLTNITYNEGTGISNETHRNYTVYTDDINNDGITEVPMPVFLPTYRKGDGTVGNHWIIHWMQYALDGSAQRTYTTYHNDADGWFLVLPDSWLGEIAIFRSESISGQRTLNFALWQGDSEESETLFTIYRLTGVNRYSRAQQGNRFVLRDEGDVIYSAEFHPAYWRWAGSVPKSGIIDRFHLIRTEWTSTDA